MVLAALFAALTAGCATPARGQGMEAGPLVARVENAQMAGTIGRNTVSLDARIWINLMPSPESPSTPVRILAKLIFAGEARRGDITVSRLWFVSSNKKLFEASIAGSQVTQEGVRITGSVRIPRDLAGRGWVVAEIKDSAGSLFIRSPETGIQRVY